MLVRLLCLDVQGFQRLICIISVIAGEGFHQSVNATPNDGMADFVVRANQFQRFALGERVLAVWRVVVVFVFVWTLAADHIVGHAFVEIRYGHIKNATQFVEAAGGDAVGAALIFLNLLERIWSLMSFLSF